MPTADTQVEHTNWPIKLYTGALVFAFVSLAVFTPTLSGAAVNAGRGAAQLAICGVLGLRLGWAMHKSEQSKTWILYVAGMFLAVPIWLIVEPLIFSLGRG